MTFRNATESNYILGAIIIQYAVLVFIHAISIYFGKLPLIAANKLCVFLFLPIQKSVNKTITSIPSTDGNGKTCCSTLNNTYLLQTFRWMCQIVLSLLNVTLSLEKYRVNVWVFAHYHLLTDRGILSTWARSRWYCTKSQTITLFVHKCSKQANESLMHIMQNIMNLKLCAKKELILGILVYFLTFRKIQKTYSFRLLHKRHWHLWIMSHLHYCCRLFNLNCRKKEDIYFETNTMIFKIKAWFPLL